MMNDVKVTFNEQMNAASINATTFTVSSAVGSGVTGTITYDATTNTATFTPSAPLAPGTPYTVIIKGGQAGVGDLAQNTLVNDFQWTFFTNRPPSAPGLVSPADAATGLPTMVALTWTKATDDDGDALSYQSSCAITSLLSDALRSSLLRRVPD
jgi:hypothetical protein